MQLRGRCWDIIALNVHVPTKDKTDDTMVSFYEEAERVFDKFPKCYMDFFFRDFSAKVGRKDIFKPTTGNDSLHEISNENGVRVVNFATSRNLIVKSTMFLHRIIQKLLGHLLMERRPTKLTIFW
jgi:hypothetical protein